MWDLTIRHVGSIATASCVGWEASVKYCVLSNQQWNPCRSSGVGVTQLISVLLFSQFSGSSKHWVPIDYHIHTWQVSPQLSCGDTCQIWMWFKKNIRYCYKIENFLNREIDEGGFSNPRPMLTKWGGWLKGVQQPWGPHLIKYIGNNGNRYVNLLLIF